MNMDVEEAEMNANNKQACMNIAGGNVKVESTTKSLNLEELCEGITPKCQDKPQLNKWIALISERNHGYDAVILIARREGKTPKGLSQRISTIGFSKSNTINPSAQLSSFVFWWQAL
ncbi:hypothetical protein BY996DRAFT_6609141 [Phakopsora pachyrhizi]|uniref:Uncharacterized protein n=1 Tax=Phakopsora pachyrhizi TaxID=170000 RepID=A0AAV0AX70_PHAPC|nr:hypothetical protein BY996DRAFT_6609141 [Phakopsora pachyrhizi]CAH7673929.1 hypothetical protein PPACK8108_LOCUS8823 [Phakopsora pachyrhizi]